MVQDNPYQVLKDKVEGRLKFLLRIHPLEHLGSKVSERDIQDPWSVKISPLWQIVTFILKTKIDDLDVLQKSIKDQNDKALEWIEKLKEVNKLYENSVKLGDQLFTLGTLNELLKDNLLQQAKSADLRLKRDIYEEGNKISMILFNQFN